MEWCTFLLVGLGTSRRNATHLKQSVSLVRLVREEEKKNSDGPELKIGMRKDDITHVSDNRGRERDRPNISSSYRHVKREICAEENLHLPCVTRHDHQCNLLCDYIVSVFVGSCSHRYMQQLVRTSFLLSFSLSLSFPPHCLSNRSVPKQCLSLVSPWSTALATRHCPFLTVKTLPGENVVGLQMNQCDPDAHLSLLSRDRFLGGWTRQEFSFLRLFRTYCS